MNYPVFTTGLVMTPRGVGTMIAMFLVARLIDRVDHRLIILIGLGLMRGVAVADDRLLAADGEGPIIISGLLQGFGLGCTFVPLNIIALSNLPRSS